MAEKQVKFSVSDALRKLEKSLQGVSTTVEEAANQAVKDLAYSTYATIISRAQSNLHTTKDAYLKGLQFEDMGGNNFLISLDGDLANSLEDGYPAFNMTPGMLASNKTVSQGQRAGQPWVQTAKDGHKFAHVPLEQKTGKAQGTSNMADAIKQMTATNAKGRKQKITSVFKDAEGNPMQGKVAMASSDNPMLDGLVKYQSTHTTESGKKKTVSTYIAYRTVSENGRPWIHPGFSGIKAFEEAEKELVKQIDNIIKELL